MLYVVIAAVVIAVVLVLIQVKKYGSFGAAFGSAVKEERKTLSDARSNVKRLEKARAKELESHQGAVSAATARVGGLENPGRGAKVGKLGPVTLHEHVVLLPRQELPLLGLTARCESGPTSSHLYLTTPDGRTHGHSFSTEWRSTGNVTTKTQSAGDYDLVTASEKMKRDFSDEEVRHLATAISNQAISEAQFVEARPAMLEEARAELVLARQALEAVTESSQLDTDLQGARQLLAQAEAQWAAASDRS